MILTRRAFAEIGEALYGSQWRRIMADKLGHTKRTVERYLSGDRSMPRTMADELDDLIDKQIELLGRYRTDQKVRRPAEPRLTDTK